MNSLEVVGYNSQGIALFFFVFNLLPQILIYVKFIIFPVHKILLKSNDMHFDNSSICKNISEKYFEKYAIQRFR